MEHLVVRISEVEAVRATEKTKIYLDMDGVLAEFFRAFAHMAGVTNGNYREIPPEKREPVIQAMHGTNFFHTLKKFPSADQLIHLVLQYVPLYGICSSPLKGDDANSERWKREWIKTHLRPQPGEMFFTQHKAQYAVQPDGTPNILIDDRGSNIQEWIAAGGIGVKYQADEDSVNIVRDALRRAYGR